MPRLAVRLHDVGNSRRNPATSHTPHELADEFPDSAQQLHDLKMSNPHFTRLFEEYHEIDRQIHRLETSVKPAGEAVEAVMRRKRMMLKDEIYAGLKADFRKPEPGE